MADTNLDPMELAPAGAGRPAVVIQNLPPTQPWLGRIGMRFVLGLSILGNLVLFGLYQTYFPSVTQSEQFESGAWTAPDKIALVEVTGMLTSESIEAPRTELERAAADAAIKAVVLIIDSPGGTISGSDELYHAIEEFKKSGKKVVAWMGGMATSGAYYIAVPADRIVAERSCVTGSIGVIAQLLEIHKLLDQIGVRSETIKSGPMKDSGSPFRPMTEEERRHWQGIIDGMYDQFLDVVLTHRAKTIEAAAGDAGLDARARLRQLADGRIFLAEEAKAVGLVDEIGYRQSAVDLAKSLAGLEGQEVRIIKYARPQGLLELLAGTAARSDLPDLGPDLGRLLGGNTPGVWLLPSWVVPRIGRP